MIRPIPDIAPDFIAKWEGLRLKAYICPAGYKTIGYGHVLKEGEPEEITIEQAQRYLFQDIEKVNLSIARLIKQEYYLDFTDGQHTALLSFTFNLGSGALQRSTLRAKINRGESREEVGDEFLRWIYAGGRILPGLVLRRQEERSLYVTG